MSDSFAGITVPEGEPGALDDAAGRFGALADTLSGVSGDLQAMPGTLTSWEGPASVTYAGTCLTNGTACQSAVQALGQVEHAARAYAAKLKAAKQRVREAIADAREAQERIDQAERDIAAAQARQAAAAGAAASAATEIAVSAAAGVPAPGAEAARSQAEADGAAAADDEARARRELARARDDLERAKRRGHEAMDDARDAGRAAAAAFAAAAGVSPAYAWVGGPFGPAGPVWPSGGGPPSWWDTTNEGAKWWDEDQFVSQLLFFHPKNDEVGRYKWWGDRAADIVPEWAKGALVAYGTRMRYAAIQDVPTLTIQYGRRFVAGPGGSVLVESLTATRGTTTVIDADMLAQAAKFGKAGKALPVIGGALAIGSAGWDQWREDSSNPNLTTTDRVGRSAGVGVYVGGASIAGAAIGTAIFPGVGTAAGLAIGATAGLVAGAVASSITPAKEFMADAGQWTANAAVDAYHWTGDRVEDIGDGISKAGDWVRDKLPDIDMPDLNPF